MGNNGVARVDKGLHQCATTLNLHSEQLVHLLNGILFRKLNLRFLLKCLPHSLCVQDRVEIQTEE